MDDIRTVRELGEVKAELAGLRAEVSGLRERIDDVVISQVRDHGKRISALETTSAMRAGERAALVAVGSVLGGLVGAAGSALVRAVLG